MTPQPLGVEGRKLRAQIIAAAIPFVERAARKLRAAHREDAVQEALERIAAAIDTWEALETVLDTWRALEGPPPAELEEIALEAIEAYRGRTRRDRSVPTSPPDSGEYPWREHEIETRVERMRDAVADLRARLEGLTEIERSIALWSLLGASNVENAEEHGVSEIAVRRICTAVSISCRIRRGARPV